MKIGYVRVSTEDQKLDMQIDALKAAGCARIFSDHGVSGARADRPGLDDALAALRPGDQFIVWKLDRAGRSVHHLAELLRFFQTRDVEFCSLTEGIDTSTPCGKFLYNVLGAVAEFILDMNRERTIEGMAAARRRGKRIGRPPKLTSGQIRKATVLTRDKSMQEIADMYCVERTTLSKAIKRQLENAEADA